MLIKFEVSNFKNFNEKLVLDFTKTNVYTFSPQCVVNNIVNKAIIYGHNGIGKSNLGFAIFDIAYHLTDKNIDSYFYENYLNAYNQGDIAIFKYEIQLTTGIVIYEYGKKEINSLVYEKISINNREYASIDRRINTIAKFHAEGAENLKTVMGESKISILSYIKNNTVLTKSKDNDCFLEFHNFINSMLFFRSLENNDYIGFEQGSKNTEKDIIDKNNVPDFQEFLNEAGIECSLNIINGVNGQNIAFDFNGKLIPFFDIASQGTRSLAGFYYWFQRLRSENSAVKFLFVDEFDAFYHHALSALIVKKLKSINAQVIITTHNTSIISNDLLRPDCYFLMNKIGIHSLSNRTVKELRKAHNIEKMYKAGVFGE